MGKNRPISSEDLNFILDHLESLIGRQALTKERILLTGATGFFGKWLTQTLIKMEDHWSCGNRITILTRDRQRALEDSPWLQGRPEIAWIEGDIRSFQTSDEFTTIIHGAAAASRALNENQPDLMFDTIVEGMKRVLAIAEQSHCRRLQVISSGAVYGVQPVALDHVPETYLGAPDPLAGNAAYGEAKRVAEFLAATSARRHGFHLSLPRCYAFIGAHLPLDKHFAAGNFLSDVLNKKPLNIGGDGTPLRSYLYAADLMVWLLTILVKSETCRPINVGSEEAMSIADLAHTVHGVACELLPQRRNLKDPVQIAKAPDLSRKPERYVPSTERARRELGLDAWTGVREALTKTLRWHLT